MNGKHFFPQLHFSLKGTFRFHQEMVKGDDRLPLQIFSLQRDHKWYIYLEKLNKESVFIHLFNKYGTTVFLNVNSIVSLFLKPFGDLHRHQNKIPIPSYGFQDFFWSVLCWPLFFSGLLWSTHLGSFLFLGHPKLASAVRPVNSMSRSSFFFFF